MNPTDIYFLRSKSRNEMSVFCICGHPDYNHDVGTAHGITPGCAYNCGCNKFSKDESVEDCLSINPEIEFNYINHAIDNMKKFIAIMKDLEDKDIYPVYFDSDLELNKFQQNIISESKVKIMKIILIKLNN